MTSHRKLVAYARNLRKNLTQTERLLWHHLRSRRFLNMKFRRQHPLGAYIVDFVCLEKRLIIEIDGSQHMEQKDYDRRRDRSLERMGYRVLRFWNNEVNEQLPVVLETIRKHLKDAPPTPHPNPSPKGRGADFKKKQKI